MQKWLWVVAACIVLGISLLSHVPAQFVLPESSGKFQFIGIRGSLWRGEVEHILFSGKALPIRELNWSVNPAAMLKGTLQADLYEQHTPANRGNMSLSLGSRQLAIQELHWQIPASSLEPWFPSPGPGMRGQLVLDLQTLQLPADSFFPSRLVGRLEWPDAGLQIGPEYWQIGSPLMQFSDEGDAIKGVVRNSQPKLPGDGSFDCTTKSCRLELSLQPSLDTPRPVLNGLLLLGLQQSGNSFSGHITLPLE